MGRQRAMVFSESPPLPVSDSTSSSNFICDFNRNESFLEQFMPLLSNESNIIYSLVNISDTTNDTLKQMLDPDELRDYIEKIQTKPIDIHPDLPSVRNEICDIDNAGRYGIGLKLGYSRRRNIWYYVAENTIGDLYDSKKDTTHSLIGLPENFINQVNIWEDRLLKMEMANSKSRKRMQTHMNRKEAAHIASGDEKHHLPPIYFVVARQEFDSHHATLLFFVDNKFYSIGVGYKGPLSRYQGSVPNELVAAPAFYTPDYMLEKEYTILDIGILRKSHLQKLQEYIPFITTIQQQYSFINDEAAQVNVTSDKRVTDFVYTGDHNIYPNSLFCDLGNMAYCAAAKNTSPKLGITNCTNFVSYIFSDRIKCNINALKNPLHGKTSLEDKAKIGLGYMFGLVDPAFCTRREGLTPISNEHIEEIYCALSKYIQTGKINEFLRIIKYDYYKPQEVDGHEAYAEATNAFGGKIRTRRIIKTKKVKRTKKAKRTRRIRKTRKNRKTRK